MLCPEPASSCHSWLDPKATAHKRQICLLERRNQEYQSSELQVLSSKSNSLPLCIHRTAKKNSKRQTKAALVKVRQTSQDGISATLGLCDWS
jgi:hypothetical protein